MAERWNQGFHLSLLYLNKQETEEGGGGGVDSSTAVGQAGIPSGTVTFLPSSRYPCHLYSWVCSRGLLRGFHMPSYSEGIPLLQYADDASFFMRVQ